MRNIKLTIEYDGTDFNGWQVQAKTQRTVQGEIEKALNIILKKKTRIYGSGRTDSGVHAFGQVAHFKTSSPMPCEVLNRALNANLPPDIIIHDVTDVPLNFHAQYNAKKKTYCYTILNRVCPCAINRRFCTHIPCRLNFTAMRHASKQLLGEHDFKSFAASNPAKRGKKESTVRRVSQIHLKKKGDYLTIEIEANGFLYKMVRNIVGTLILIGTGKLAKDSIARILEERDRSFAGETAPALGLCLMEVKY
ncbi:MAG: tRNA pseudouridine(38-40) synthase TruA [Candidatus Omnitrophota bacterium]